ncbi:MAG: hypothetical protein LBU62_07105 [Bacteroidales bacterium]|nr:hypothetical protein [Bacteroidales bacterium]
MKTFRFLPVFISFLFCLSCSGTEKSEIRASEILKILKKGGHIQMVDKIILDDLDFTQASELFIVNANQLQCEINASIFFSHCIFMGKVTTNGRYTEKLPVQTSFKNNLVFSACDFRGAAHFDQTVVFGMFNFSQSVFRESASFNHVAVWAKDSYFSEMVAEKDFSMVYAAFAGNFHCLSARFAGNVSFQETSFWGKLVFNQSEFKGRVGFDLISVYGNAFFHHTKFEKFADFSSSRFLHTADFVNTVFGGKGSFEKATFLNTARFVGVDTKNDLNMNDIITLSKIKENENN